MTDTIERMSKLGPNSGDLDIANAYGPMSDFILRTFEELQAQKGSVRFLKRFQQLLQKDPLQSAEAIETYFLVPFQRLITEALPIAEAASDNSTAPAQMKIMQHIPA